MQIKHFKNLFLLVFVFLMTLACGLTPTIITPTIPSLTLTNIPAPTPLPADTCPSETADLKLLMNAEDGYCLLYPAEHTVLPPRFIVINPTNALGGDKLGDAYVDIIVEAAADRTAAQVADNQIAEAGAGFNITRSEILVDGMQAVVVDGLPGPDPLRKVFIVSNDRLYTLNFLPWAPNADEPTPLEKLYSTVIGTLHFLSSPSPSLSAPLTGTVTGNLSFPSSFIPAMRVAFFSLTDGSIKYTDTGMNQGTYSIDLPAGDYHVVAYPYSAGAPASGSPIEGGAGGYTQAVPCGLSADCTDHSLIPVTVVVGQTIIVNPGDWYAPEGTFPPMPTDK